MKPSALFLAFCFAIATPGVGLAQKVPTPAFKFITQFKGIHVPLSYQGGVTKDEFVKMKKMIVRWTFTGDAKKIGAAVEAEMKAKGGRKRLSPTDGYVKGGAFAFFQSDRNFFPETKKNVTCTFEHVRELPKK